MAFQGAKLAELTADGVELYLRKREEMEFEKWVTFFLENYSKPPIRAAKSHNANLRATKHLKAG